MGVGLEDEAQLRPLAPGFLHAVEELLGVGDPGLNGGGEAALAALLLARLGDLAGPLVVLHDDEVVAGGRDIAEPDDLHRLARARTLDPRPAPIVERAHPPELAPGDEGLADLERTPAHEDRRHRPAPLLQARLQDRPLGRAVGVGAEFQKLALKEDRLQESLDSLAARRRDGDDLHIAA